MLDRIDFASWKQCIGLYCREKDKYNADIRETNILLQWLPKDIYSLINHYTDAKDIWDNVKMLLEGSELTKEDRESQVYDDFKHFRQHKGETIHDYYVRFSKLINDIWNIKMTMSRMQLNSKFVNNMLPKWGRFVTVVKLNRGLRDSNYDKLYAYLKQHEGRQNRGQGNNAWGTGAASYRGAQNRVGYANPDNIVDDDVDEQPIQDLALNVDTVFHADGCDAFDSDVDEASTAQTVFMANLSSAYPVYDEAGSSYDSDVLSECVKDNAVQAVQSNVSSIPNDAYMMILNDMHEPPVQHMSVTTQTKVVHKSLTAELATYKEQVELYERRARFELTEREQKIDEQLRIVITDRNIKKKNLKKELHSVK
uniref:Putative zinc finger, CCHC-type n=1 Tax=Tanacetum cinerariifolium TaxID=118510 RepID=A0A6L2JYX3_TANCI|nr:putative zinc finger, CCHC-type [Tanacetum cinerariifolium]